MGFESSGGVVQASFLPSMGCNEKVVTRYNLNKYSSFLVPTETHGVDGSISVHSADNSNNYLQSNYSLVYGMRVPYESKGLNAQFGVRSEEWYSTGRYSNTTVANLNYGIHPESTKEWKLPIVSAVTDPSGGMVIKCGHLPFMLRITSDAAFSVQVGVFGMTVRLDIKSLQNAGNLTAFRRVFIVEPDGQFQQLASHNSRMF